MGMNVWIMTTGQLSIQERTELVTQGQLSRISLVDRYSALALYPTEYTRVKYGNNIPVLNQANKNSGWINFNHFAYIGISDYYLHDAISTLKSHPNTYLKSVFQSWFIYFESSSHYEFLRGNLSKIWFMNNLYDYFVYWKIPYNITQNPYIPINQDRPHYVFLALMLGLPALIIVSLNLTRKKSRGNHILSQDKRILVYYICFNIIYVACIGNFLERGENNRFRFQTDPLSAFLIGLYLQFSLIPWIVKKFSQIGGSKIHQI
jgi:hypothetical protein